MAHAIMGSKQVFTDVPYNPNQIPGLQMWLDGKDPFNTGIPPAASAPVGTWVDKSGNGNNGTGIANPPYLSGGGVSLNGSTQYFTTNYTNAPTNETAFMVVKYAVSTGTNPIISSTNNSGGRWIYNNSTTMAMQVYGNPGVFNGTATFTAGTTFMYDYAYSSTNVSSFLNGTADATVANPPTFYGAGATNIGYATYPLPTQTFANASIYEIIIFNTVLTASQRQVIEGYLAWKWNLQSSLSISHPYYYSSPAVAYPSAPFVPRQIQGLQMWLDGSDPNGTGVQPSASSAVNIWVDKSGKGFSGTGVAGPTYVNGGGINFNGSTQYYTTTYTAAPSTETVFFVVNYNSISGSLPLIGNNGVSNSRTILLNNASIQVTVYNGAGYAGLNTVSTGRSFIWDYTYTGSLISTFYNGNTELTAAASYSGAGTTNIGYTPASFMNGTIYEVLIYNTVLTLQQRQAVEGYLGWKWGLRRSLQVSHPYYSVAPSSLYLTTPFNPEQIPGVQMWLDGADPNGTGLQPSSVINTWADKSGKGNNGTGVGSPTYTAGGIALNGTQYYTTTYTAAPTTETAFIVFKAAYPGLNISVFPIADNNVTGSRRIVYNNSNLSLQSSPSTNALTGTTSISANTQYIYDYIYTAGATSTSFVNGIQDVTNTSSLVFSGAGVTWIGYANTGAYMNGTISEIIIFNSSLSTFQRQTVEGYLSWKWGLQTTLPVTHPYYSAAPTAYFATAFVPKQIPGLQMWLDAADPLATGTAPAASSVTTWSDKSGNARNATGVAGPTYVSGGGISFNGTSQYYTTTYSAVPTTETVFIVFKASNTPVFPIADNNVADSRRIVYNNNLSLQANPSTNRLTGTTTVAANTQTIYDYIYTSGGTSTSFVNGTQDVTNATSLAFSGAGVTWIAYANSGAYMNGTIYEIIIYNTSLTTQQRQTVEGYLAWKWSLQTTLPSTHPFRYIAPNANSIASLAPSYSSSYLPGLIAWYDAADPLGTGVPVANSTVMSNWFDKSGNSNTMIAAGAPTYTTGSQNGLPGITLSGNSGTTITNYYRTTIAPGTFLAELDAFVVYKNTSAVTNNTLINRSLLENVGNPLAIRDTFVFVGFNNSTSFTSSYNLYNTNTSLYNINLSQATAATSKVTAYTNGTAITLTGGTTWTPSDIGTVLTLGSRGDQFTGFNGLFYEVMVFNSPLSTGQRQYIEGYLAWKWGITLAATHPYYTSSPNINTLFFQPNQIVGLNLWLDGADPLNTGAAPANATAITTWFDKSPFMLNAVGTASPTYVSGSISFNGTTQYYTIQYTGSPSTETAFMVVKFNNVNTNQTIIGGTPTITSTRTFYLSGGLLFLYKDNNAAIMSPNTVLTTNTFMYDYTYSTSAIAGYNNGLQDGSAGATTAFASGASTRIGVNGTTTQFLNGTVSEIVIFNRVLSQFERQTMEGYLSWKWGLQTTLPVSHPYFSVQPTLLTFSPSYTSGILATASTYLPLQTDYNDVGTNPQSVTVNGTITTTQILGKRCIAFSNVSANFLSFPIANNNGMTFAFWFNTNNTAYYTMASYTNLTTPAIQFDTPSVGSNITYAFLPSATSAASSNLGTNIWNFIALTINQTTFVQTVYMNGSNASTATGSAALANSPTTFVIGKSGDNVNNTRAYSGYIQNFMYFNTVLTGGQIASLYEQTSQDLTPPTAASGLSFTATQPTLTLTWSAPANINSNASAGNNVTSYLVNFYGSATNVTTGGLLQFTYSTAGLTQSITPTSNYYYATVTPVNSGVLGTATQSSTLLSFPAAPTAVTMGSFAAQQTTISVSWTASPLATSYTINFLSNSTDSTTGGTVWQTFTGTGTSQTSSSTLISGTTGTYYYATVTAVNASGSTTSTSSSAIRFYIPLWITGLQVWYDPTDVLNTGTNPANGAVATWYDKSGNTRNATGVNGPTLNNGIVGFNGTTQSYTTAYSASNAAESVFFIANTGGTTGPADWLGASANGGREIQISNTKVYVKKLGGATINTGTNTITAGVYFMFSHTFTTTSSSTYINGSNDHIGANGGGYTAAANTYIGRSGTTGSNYLNGNFIGSIMIYNVALSSTYRQIVEGWLAWRWGTTGVGRLVAGHPYKNASP